MGCSSILGAQRHRGTCWSFCWKSRQGGVTLRRHPEHRSLSTSTHPMFPHNTRPPGRSHPLPGLARFHPSLGEASLPGCSGLRALSWPKYVLSGAQDLRCHCLPAFQQPAGWRRPPFPARAPGNHPEGFPQAPSACPVCSWGRRSERLPTGERLSPETGVKNPSRGPQERSVNCHQSKWAFVSWPENIFSTGHYSPK